MNVVKVQRMFVWALLLVLWAAPLALAGYKPPKDQKPPRETGSSARAVEVVEPLMSFTLKA